LLAQERASDEVFRQGSEEAVIAIEDLLFRSSHAESLILPFQVTVTPYLVRAARVGGGIVADHLFLQRHTKSGLFIPIGGGKLDPTDKTLFSGMLREYFEEADVLPAMSPIIGRSGTNLFDIGFIRQPRSTKLSMVDLRLAFRVLDDAVGRTISYTEKPDSHGVVRGDDAQLIPLGQLEQWDPRGPSGVRASATAEDLHPLLSPELALKALEIDPAYFDRFHRLRERLKSEQSGHVTRTMTS
jgi:8-oxo-dGTP pyrophosphatase MutT (NUDIX family)